MFLPLDSAAFDTDVIAAVGVVIRNVWLLVENLVVLNWMSSNAMLMTNPLTPVSVRFPAMVRDVVGNVNGTNGRLEIGRW